MSGTEIYWPEQHHPDNAAVHVANSLDMRASAQAIWSCLIHASDWPRFYPNASNVEILDAGGADNTLKLGTRFRWKTFGMTIETNVVECEPYERLAWEAHSMGMHVYHAWLITAQEEGCHVVTEETQNGLLPRVANLLMPGNMHKQHQIWLENMDQFALSSEAR